MSAEQGWIGQPQQSRDARPGEDRKWRIMMGFCCRADRMRWSQRVAALTGVATPSRAVFMAEMPSTSASTAPGTQEVGSRIYLEHGLHRAAVGQPPRQEVTIVNNDEPNHTACR